MTTAILSLEQHRAQTTARIEASRLGPRLWQGAMPPEGHALRENGFHVLVLAAKEYQPPEDRFPGVQVLHVPLNDNEAEHPLLPAEWARVQNAALLLSRLHAQGNRVLITCAQGRNRSGIISGVLLHLLTGMSGTACIDHVRTHRKSPHGPSLTNGSFVAALAKIPPAPPPGERQHVRRQARPRSCP